MHRLDKGLSLVLVGVFGFVCAFIFTSPPPRVAASFPDYEGVIVWGGTYLVLAICILVGVYLISTTPRPK
jgi:hypothetical protein